MNAGFVAVAAACVSCACKMPCRPQPLSRYIVLRDFPQPEQSYSCVRRRNWRRHSYSRSLLPGNTMKNQKDEPTGKCDQPAGNSNKHEPSHHPEIVKKLAVLVSIDNARICGAFIYLA